MVPFLSSSSNRFLLQIDKKKKSVLDQTAKGEKVLADPNSPKFLEGHVNKLKALWVESNKCADDRMALLKGEMDLEGVYAQTTHYLTIIFADNLSNWERYESSRDSLDKQLEEAVSEFKATRRIYDQSANVGDHATRRETRKVVSRVKRRCRRCCYCTGPRRPRR